MEQTSKSMIHFSLALMVLTASVTAALAIAVYVALPLLGGAGVILRGIDWSAITKGLLMGTVIIVILAYLMAFLIKLARRTFFPKPGT